MDTFAPVPRLAPLPGFSRPVGRRRWMALIAALALALIALAACQFLGAGPGRPGALGGYQLVGARGPSCLRLIIGMDVSGSMRGYSAARDDALRQLVGWAGQPHTLGPRDQLAVVDFAQTAAIRSSPRPVSAPAELSPPPVTDGRDTLLHPLLQQIKTFRPTTCDSVLVLLSDAQLADLPPGVPAGDKLLSGYGIHDIRLLVPSSSITVWRQWPQAFPSAQPLFFDGTNSSDTAIAFGRVIAGLTGQRLEPR